MVKSGFHISRWKYWWGYLAVCLLVFFSIWLYDGGSDSASFILVGIAVVFLLIFEFLVRLERLSIEESCVTYSKGIFSRNIVRVSYKTISNISVKQSIIQRVLGFGGLLIDTPGGPETEIVLKDFESPAKIEKIVAGHIHAAHSFRK